MYILFLCFAPVHKMHFTDMYISDISAHFDTDIWDISMLGGTEDKINTEYPEIPRIRDVAEFEQRIERLTAEHSGIAVITNTLIYNLYLIYPVLHRRQIPVIQIDKESIIFWMRDNYLVSHRQEIPEAEKSKYFWTSFPLTRKIYRFLEYRHMKFDYMLGARNYFPESTRRFIHIHNLKYDEYIKSTVEAPVLQEKYILFMDAGLAHLPSVSGKSNSIDRDDYLHHMNLLFDRLEERYGIQVVIAAHPKSEYPEDAFHGRKVILYKTAALARYAEFVLAHYSTSLFDLVMQKKPVVFLYSRDYMDSASRTILITTIEYAHMLNAPLVDIHKEEEMDFSYPIDELAYEKFATENIVNRDKKASSNAELICDFLKSLEHS